MNHKPNTKTCNVKLLAQTPNKTIRNEETDISKHTQTQLPHDVNHPRNRTPFTSEKL